MHPNEQCIQTFYTAFQRQDAAAMNACYHPDIVFSDPVFGRLQGSRATAMWQMLCGRAKDLEVTFNNVRADDHAGTADWEARYTFGKSGRTVHNVIHATFQFRDGLIVEHHDRFDLWRWTRMALGPTGMFLGWTPMVQAAVRKEARQGLDAFVTSQAGTTP